jgi:tetratricopeptide (TPR) repeat protein
MLEFKNSINFKLIFYLKELMMKPFLFFGGLFCFAMFSCDSYQPDKMPLLEDYGDASLKAINIATQKYPRTSTNYYRKGLILWDMGKRKEALESISKAVEMNDSRGEYHLFLAQTYVENDSMKAAFEAAQKAESLGLDTLALNELQADLYLLHRKPEPALDHINAALQKDPNIPENHLRKGNILLALSKPEEAEQSLLQCLSLDPESDGASKALADIYLARGDYDNALVYIDKNLAKSPGDVDYLYKKGVAKAETGQLNPSVDLFRSVIVKDDSYQPAYSRLGDVYYRKRKFDSARYFSNYALRLDDQDTEALLTMGRINDRQKAYWVALNYYDKIQAIDSTHSPGMEERKKLKGKIAWLNYLEKNKSSGEE